MNGGTTTTTGSVKAAVSMFGQNSSINKPLVDHAASSARTTRDLHFAKKDRSQYKETVGAAESEKARVESELSNSRKIVTELSSMIDNSNLNAKAHMRDIRMINKLEKDKEMASSAAVMTMRTLEENRYEQVIKELQVVKQELSKLKLDMAAVKDVILQAEKEADVSNSKLLTISSSVQSLGLEVEAANEEHVLVELARIEALKEYREIQAEREKESSEFSFELDKVKKKIQELDQSKELENKLACTLADVNVLQNELQLVKKMDKTNKTLKPEVHSLQKTEESDLLQSITDELEAAKKELALIKADSFQFMASMDILRNELIRITAEAALLRKTEEDEEFKVEKLKSKLLRAKSKLEVVTASEDKASITVANLTLTLERLKAEAESAKQEKALIIKETQTLKEEIQKTETNIDKTEERLQVAMQELELLKSSEFSALESLKNVTENTMRARAAASWNGSSIVISKFEYDYLTSRARAAQELADKKVAAAKAWIEALKESEGEILMKCEMAHRDIREMRVEEEKSAGRMSEEQAQDMDKLWEKKEGTEGNSNKPSRKSMKMTSWREVKMRKSASPAYRTGRRDSLTGKRKEAMPNLSRLFNGKSADKHM
ncbi:hypothetical protein ACFE04_005560 [Oxalis oulophora]